MKVKVIDMTRRKDLRRPRLFIPDRQECQVYQFSKPERQEQEEPSVEDRLDELWDQVVDIQHEIMILTTEVEKEGKRP